MWWQAEERTLWAAQKTYIEMSPYMYADRIKKPILLIHGDEDNNAGTMTMQVGTNDSMNVTAWMFVTKPSMHKIMSRCLPKTEVHDFQCSALITLIMVNSAGRYIVPYLGQPIMWPTINRV